MKNKNFVYMLIFSAMTIIVAEMIGMRFEAQWGKKK